MPYKSLVINKFISCVSELDLKELGDGFSWKAGVKEGCNDWHIFEKLSRGIVLSGVAPEVDMDILGTAYRRE